jgi:hypothetical protein
MLGILAMLIVGMGTLLIGRGTLAGGAGQAAYLVSGAVVPSLPFLMLGRFYMASLSSQRVSRASCGPRDRGVTG